MTPVLQELEELSAEYIRLLNEKQVLIDWGKPQLEALYLLHVGQLQIKRLNLQLQVMALKRKIELVNASINTGQSPDMIAIELEVATELAEAEQNILTASHEYANALFYFKHLETPERTADLRKAYCRLAKKLHPDVNPGHSEWHAQLWLRVLEAYEAGDLEQLLAFELIYKEELSMETVVDETTAASRAEILRLSIRSLESEIKMIRSQFPFTHADLLYDEEWIKLQQDALEDEIGQLAAYEGQLRSELDNLLA